MAIVDGNGLPLGITIHSASPAECTLVEETLREIPSRWRPSRLIGDKAYDSDKLDRDLLDRHGIELIAPNRVNRKKMTQDLRPLRRYVRRWKVERFFAWLNNFRRLVTRYERRAQNYLGFLELACVVILTRSL
jgi:transposase